MSSAVPVVGGSISTGVVVEFVDSDGGRIRGDLGLYWDFPFDRVASPIRAFPSFRGQRNFSGWWWMSTTGTHVDYESWLERDNLMVLDADRDVVAVVSQPFRLSWADESADRRRRHVPDYFVRRGDGSVEVVDVRAEDRIEPTDAAAFAATAAACGRVGWAYRRVGMIDPALAANLRWLSGYRHPRNRVEPVAAALIAAFAERAALLDGARAVGEPIAVLPTLYHLLWTGELAADIAVLMGGRTGVVSVVGGRR